MTIAWQEYNDFFIREQIIFSTYDSLDKTKGIFPQTTPEMIKSLDSQQNHDFWLAISNDANLSFSSFPISEEAKLLFLNYFSNNIKDKEVFYTSEILPRNFFSGNEKLLQKCIIPLENDLDQNFTKVLVQLTSLAVKDEQDQNIGYLIGGKIMNNNCSLTKSYSKKVPHSYLSIGIQGIRICSNIKSLTNEDFLGKTQSRELIEKIKANKKFIGQAQLQKGDVHFITSEPIHNSSGQVIAALSIGIPSYGFTNLKRDSIFLILNSFIICLSLAIILVSIVAKKISKPITHFSKLAMEISTEKSFNQNNIKKIKELETSQIQEISYLQNCFLQMSEALYKKSQEAENYLKELELEHSKLQELHDKLLKTNFSLEKKVAERTYELQRAVEELKTTNNLKTMFLANISHEIRTPLNSIIGFSEMLNEEIFGPLNNKQKEYIKIILSSSKHLLQVINDILDLSKIERGEISLSKEMVSIDNIINSVKTITYPQMKDKKLNLQIEMGKDLPNIYADPVRIKQVLYNLISNSIKFTPEKGHIKIKVSRKKEVLAITVADTGIGIEEDKQKRIFDEFYQCEEIYKRKFEGVGLGLPLSKKLIEMHDGKIALKSKPGKGTEMTFYLPLQSTPRI